MGPKHVGFSTIEIIEFPITLGCNPSVSSGPPLTIEWEPQQRTTFDLDMFEEYRPERRHRLELPLDAFIREEVLVESGIGLDQILFWKEISAENDVKKSKRTSLSQSFRRAMKLPDFRPRQRRSGQKPQRMNPELFQLSSATGLGET